MRPVSRFQAEETAGGYVLLFPVFKIRQDPSGQNKIL